MANTIFWENSMTIHKLIDYNDPMLSNRLDKVSENCDRKKIKEDLIETMKKLNGMGLSANQVGIKERAFVMYNNFAKRETVACFNPEIIHESEEQGFMEEGCLSYPGLWLKIKRPVWVEVKYENENGEQIKNKFTDLEARVFLHEYDHMEGIDFTKRVSRLRLDIAKKRQKKMKKRSLDISKKT